MPTFPRGPGLVLVSFYADEKDRRLLKKNCRKYDMTITELFLRTMEALNRARQLKEDTLTVSLEPGGQIQD